MGGEPQAIRRTATARMRPGRSFEAALGRSNADLCRKVIAPAQMPAMDGIRLCNLVRNSYRVIANNCKAVWQFLSDDPDRIGSNPRVGTCQPCRLASQAERLGPLITPIRRRGAQAGRSVCDETGPRSTLKSPSHPAGGADGLRGS